MESTSPKNKQKNAYATFVKNIAIILKKVNPYFNGQKKFIKKHSVSKSKKEVKNETIIDNEIKLTQQKSNEISKKNNDNKNKIKISMSTVNYILKNKPKINKSTKKNDLLKTIIYNINKKYLKLYYQKWNSISKIKNVFSHNFKPKIFEDKKKEMNYYQKNIKITENNNKYNNTKTTFTSDLSTTNLKANSTNKTKIFPFLHLNNNNNNINNRYSYFKNDTNEQQVFFNSQKININNNMLYKSNINSKINNYNTNNNINNISSNNIRYENNNNYSNNYRIYNNNQKSFNINSKSVQINEGKTSVIQHYFGKTERINEYKPSLVNNKPLTYSYKYDQSNMINNLYNTGRNYNCYYNNYNYRYKSIDESSHRDNPNSYQYYFSYCHYK